MILTHRILQVMDEQKWSSCSWLLLHEFVKLHKQHEEERDAKIASGEISPDDPEAELRLPAIPYVRVFTLHSELNSWANISVQWKCRVIMTRPDFLEQLDRLNIISIDVRPLRFYLTLAMRPLINASTRPITMYDLIACFSCMPRSRFAKRKTSRKSLRLYATAWTRLRASTARAS
jgi:hypothetical protein